MHHDDPGRRTAGSRSGRPAAAELCPWVWHVWPAVVRRAGLPAAAGLTLLLATGFIVVATAPLQAPSHQGWHAVVVVTAAMTGLISIASCVPWRFLPPHAVLVFPAAVLILITALSIYGDGLGAAYVGVYVLAFVYVGLFTPPHTCWWLLPLALVLYGPTAGGWSRDIAVRLVVVALVWVLVAEVVGMLDNRQRQAMQALDAASRTDVLTSLGNRRALQDHLETLSPGVAVVVCDLDHFKHVNDSHGHHHGDLVLAGFARALHESLRHGDHAARYGGEEFVLLLRVMPSEVPSELARLHQRWAMEHPHITFSTGWAVHTASRGAQATIDAADQALYRAKELGRNRDETEADAPPSSVHRPAVPMSTLGVASAADTTAQIPESPGSSGPVGATYMLTAPR